jgi:hypothetical protein
MQKDRPFPKPPQSERGYGMQGQSLEERIDETAYKRSCSVFFLRGSFFISLGKCLMLRIMGLWQRGHRGLPSGAISSLIQALQFSPLQRHTGTGVVAGFSCSFVMDM